MVESSRQLTSWKIILEQILGNDNTTKVHMLYYERQKKTCLKGNQLVPLKVLHYTRGVALA